MKKMPSILLALALLVCAPALMLTPGCQTANPEAKALVTVTMTVDGAMQGWAAWVVRGQATPEQEARVKVAYEKYQAVEALAEKVYATAYATRDAAVLSQIVTQLQNAQKELLALVAEFTKGKP